ncbi:xylose isomerase [Halolactibacillus miurensis]|uniref:Sugar phosphate isomerase/epimerase n=1 Tax=Halolactibacillus miurensis TaxID=306541 RepID=A0A1I6RY27_9BACI|nr:TIM barrel protein [Halolactibacillus miurensis]GEM04550.1 xylose isomerase [Halolactibacillus miurensis]SFS69594.1 Sugar phosphate isomerase/epimerase [Halolactibacillus miurensis]
MRLGGYVFVDHLTPETWVNKHLEKGFNSAVLPINHTSSQTERNDYVSLAKEHDILLSEVGAWSNPISSDLETRKKAIDYIKKQLAFSDEIGARTCVNIAGSLGATWDGPDCEHYTQQTFELIAKTVQDIIDDVKPTQTTYSLEMMPYTPPSDVWDYKQLVDMIDRDAFKIHFDPVNMINNPKRYYRNRRVMSDFIDELGDLIVNVHLKDLLLTSDLTVHLKEVLPGTGQLDYPILLKKLDTLDPDLPVIIEHLPDEMSYDLASQFIREVASKNNLTWK